MARLRATGDEMDECEAVLAANARFYGVFAAADLAGMAAVWATGRDDVSVVHPGAPAITGRAAVLETWRAIFDGAPALDIVFADAVARVYGDIAIVLCSETVTGHGLTATNIFCRTDDGWRMLHHHAGPRRVSGQPPDRRRPVLH